MKRVACKNHFRKEWSSFEIDCDTLDGEGVGYVLVEAPEIGSNDG